MRETIDQLNGAVIQNIEIRTDDDTDTNQGEYGSYEYLITTDKGTIRFSGCHDTPGYVEVSAGLHSPIGEDIKFVHLPGR